MKLVDELRRRDIGDVHRGPLQVFVGGPGEYKPTPMPKAPLPESLPKEPIPVDVTSHEFPWYVRHPIAFGLPAAAAHAVGAGPLGAAAAGGAGAFLAHKILPSGRYFTEAPLSMRQEEWARLLPILGGALGAQGLEQSFLGGMR